MKIELTLDQLQSLLVEQKKIVIDRIYANSGSYNTESDDGNYRTLPIDKDKMFDIGIKSSYPNDFEVLCKYSAK